MRKFKIGLLTVMILVGLRLALGCHFLYEGVWKIKHADEFTAEPFLTQAKGPVASFFYSMVPDIDGRQRLRISTDADGKKSVDSDAIVARWDKIRRDFLAYYSSGKTSEAAEKTYNEFTDRLKKYLADNADAIAAHFGALDRFEAGTDESHRELDQDAPFQKKRHWDRMMELRSEVNGWIKDIKAQEKAYRDALYSLLDDQQKARGPGLRDWNPIYWGRGWDPLDWDRSWNPRQWDRMDQINLAVTYGLTAIGACLMLGLCSRLAALGGAAFMCFVVMTQPAFPTIYPPDPSIVGHALLINKDFIELMALLVIASVPAGRWGGLDFFLHRILRAMFWRRRNTEQ